MLSSGHSEGKIVLSGEERQLMDKNQGRESLFPKMTIGVMGSAGGLLTDEVCQPVRRLGAAIAKRG